MSTISNQVKSCSVRHQKSNVKGMMVKDVNQLPNPLTKTPPDNLHLIVTAHGLWQPPYHMDFWRDTFLQNLDNTIVFNSISNSLQRSTCGIATTGQRMANEITDFIKTHQNTSKITKISFLSYSAGGIWAHYAATALFNQGLFNTIQPQFFITIATPNLGVYYQPSHTTHFFLFRIFHNCLIGNCSGCIGGRTLEDLIFADDPDDPILLQMSRNNNAFGKCLQLFNERISYGNTRNDFSVPFESSMMAMYNPYAIGELKYPNTETEERFNFNFIENKEMQHRATCCTIIWEILLGTFLLIGVFGIWLPVVATLSLGFTLPMFISLITKCWCYDKTSNRKQKGTCCFGCLCCGIDSLCPCHCLKRSFCGNTVQRNDDIWMQMYNNRKLQNIKRIPVTISSGGNAHGKIANRPCCCFSDYWKEGRDVAMNVVSRMKKGK